MANVRVDAFEESALKQKEFGYRIRKIILEQSNRAHVGHIGSALSIADLIAVLYDGVLRIEEPGNANRDRFILSKGHASLALYAGLHLRGWIGAAELDTYCGDGTVLGVHPEATAHGIDFATGSLGQGLCFGAGAALAARLQGSDRRTYVLMSDAECNEGSVWEAALFAAHHRLNNLIAVVDVNAQQALGYTDQVLKLEPLCAKWSAFGWDAVEVDGHDAAALQAILETGSARPRVVLARTVFGKGVSFMERRIEWHYLPMSDSQFEMAMAEIEELR